MSLVQYSTYYLACAFSMQMVEVLQTHIFIINVVAFCQRNSSFIVFNGLVY